MTTDTHRRPFSQRPAVKLVVLAVLALLLLLPIGLVLGLVHEREHRRSTVLADVARSWGGRQELRGPVLVVPHTVWVEEDGKTRSTEHRAYFLPETLTWSGTLQPETRHRGIFDVVVFEGDLSVSGSFAAPDVVSLGIDPATVDWRRAALVLGVSDVRGLQERTELELAGSRIPFEPGNGGGAELGGGLHVSLPELASWPPGETVPFRFHLRLRGSETIQFTPVGEDNQVQLESTWSDPGFVGSFLPREPTIGADGFSADWQVPFFGRNYPQAWSTDDLQAGQHQLLLVQSAFGVRLVLPADAYQKTERSVKYAVLFIGLTFLVFFLQEVLAGLRIHPMQYVMVGVALALFYLLLLAVSEHLDFTASYLAAAGGTIALIVGYSRHLLRSSVRSLTLSGALVALYGLLFVLLQLEEYALLVGSLGLFAALATIMGLTRRLDWYTLGGIGRPQP